MRIYISDAQGESFAKKFGYKIVSKNGFDLEIVETDAIYDDVTMEPNLGRVVEQFIRYFDSDYRFTVVSRFGDRSCRIFGCDYTK